MIALCWKAAVLSRYYTKLNVTHVWRSFQIAPVRSTSWMWLQTPFKFYRFHCSISLYQCETGSNKVPYEAIP